MKYFLLLILFFPIIIFAQSVPTLLWTEYYGGDYTDCFRSIIETSDGSMLLGGYIKPAATENYDLYLLKVDTNGQIEWELIYPNGTSNTESERIEKIIPTSDGNFVALVRIFEWYPLNGTWLMKFDTDGNILWIQEYYGYCVAEDFVETDDSGFLILGRGDDNSLFDDFWLLRVDDVGNIVWEFENDPMITQLDWAIVYSIINHDSEDSYIFSGHGINNSFFCKINDDGEILWLEFNLGVANKIIQVESEFVFYGCYDGELSILYINNSGVLIDSTNVAVQDSIYLYDFNYTPENGYVFMGIYQGLTGMNWKDIYVANVNNGELQWQETYNIGNNEHPNSLCISDENYFYIGGIVYGDTSLAFLSKFEFNNTSIENNTIVENPNYELQNHPNPFNPSTTISFFVTQTPSFVTLEICNLKGQIVKELPVILSGVEGSATWNGNNKNDIPVSSGIYFYKLNVNGKTEAVKKCLLLK